MSDDFKVERSNIPEQQGGQRIIDESNYKIHGPQEKGPAIVGRGGDPLFMNIRASKTQLEELLEETTTVQDWVQRETSNNVALSCLDNENLKETYFAIKDGFGEYGPILLMGFKTPQGVEIPRLKILDKNGDVIEVLTGPLAIDELNKRALAYKSIGNNYEEVTDTSDEITSEIQEYNG